MPRLRCVIVRGNNCVQAAPVLQVLTLVVPVVRYWYLEVPVPVPVQSTRQYWYQYWYTEGTSFGSVFRYKYVWPKKALLATHAGWLGTNRPHFWVVFLATRAAQSGPLTVPKLRYSFISEQCHTASSLKATRVPACANYYNQYAA